MTAFIQVVTTVDTKDHATRIAQHLLDRRLAGCVQVTGPITSSYWWKGKIETSEECYCVIKTAADRYTEVEREIRAVHPYEEPEILAFPVVSGSKTYLQWLAGSVKSE
jgi:periplasmic divalent cation tolerance protein